MTTAADVLREHGIEWKDAPRYYTTCPRCSHLRTRKHQKSKCLGVTVDADGVRWGSNHDDCRWTGGQRFNGAAPKQNGERLEVASRPAAKIEDFERRFIPNVLQ
jgi:hypothetical protein